MGASFYSLFEAKPGLKRVEIAGARGEVLPKFLFGGSAAQISVLFCAGGRALVSKALPLPPSLSTQILAPVGGIVSLHAWTYPPSLGGGWLLS